ncbi:unnamed protein product [Vitrella brassicaformis CCMP3155]|uniref:Uncharacterized protein n=2 Tax=Vitrella brassicaformis TaxID=1169539 RepID=A0A0G4GBZ3_VITBC|nr:unnamed protein product [Vitrella brassicaformis CCMP3155]|eukprot:CEM26363.1 unnamed protein product [Vitrella brassicaformis CCMP3155]
MDLRFSHVFPERRPLRLWLGSCTQDAPLSLQSPAEFLSRSEAERFTHTLRRLKELTNDGSALRMRFGSMCGSSPRGGDRNGTALLGLTIQCVQVYQEVVMLWMNLLGPEHQEFLATVDMVVWLFNHLALQIIHSSPGVSHDAANYLLQAALELTKPSSNTTRTRAARRFVAVQERGVRHSDAARKRRHSAKAFAETLREPRGGTVREPMAVEGCGVYNPLRRAETYTNMSLLFKSRNKYEAALQATFRAFHCLSQWPSEVLPTTFNAVPNGSSDERDDVHLLRLIEMRAHVILNAAFLYGENGRTSEAVSSNANVMSLLEGYLSHGQDTSHRRLTAYLCVAYHNYAVEALSQVHPNEWQISELRHSAMLDPSAPTSYLSKACKLAASSLGSEHPLTRRIEDSCAFTSAQLFGMEGSSQKRPTDKSLNSLLNTADEQQQQQGQQQEGQEDGMLPPLRLSPPATSRPPTRERPRVSPSPSPSVSPQPGDDDPITVVYPYGAVPSSPLLQSADGRLSLMGGSERHGEAADEREGAAKHCRRRCVVRSRLVKGQVECRRESAAEQSSLAHDRDTLPSRRQQRSSSIALSVGLRTPSSHTKRASPPTLPALEPPLTPSSIPLSTPSPSAHTTPFVGSSSKRRTANASTTPGSTVPPCSSTPFPSPFLSSPRHQDQDRPSWPPQRRGRPAGALRPNTADTPFAGGVAGAGRHRRRQVSSSHSRRTPHPPGQTKPARPDEQPSHAPGPLPGKLSPTVSTVGAMGGLVVRRRRCFWEDVQESLRPSRAWARPAGKSMPPALLYAKRDQWVPVEVQIRAALVIQRAWRGTAVRLRVRLHKIALLMRIHSSARIIQRRFREHRDRAALPTAPAAQQPQTTEKLGDVERPSTALVSFQYLDEDTTPSNAAVLQYGLALAQSQTEVAKERGSVTGTEEIPGEGGEETEEHHEEDRAPFAPDALPEEERQPSLPESEASSHVILDEARDNATPGERQSPVHSDHRLQDGGESSVPGGQPEGGADIDVVIHDDTAHLMPDEVDENLEEKDAEPAVDEEQGQAVAQATLSEPGEDVNVDQEKTSLNEKNTLPDDHFSELLVETPVARVSVGLAQEEQGSDDRQAPIHVDEESLLLEGGDDSPGWEEPVSAETGAVADLAAEDQREDEMSPSNQDDVPPSEPIDLPLSHEDKDITAHDGRDRDTEKYSMSSAFADGHEVDHGATASLTEEVFSPAHLPAEAGDTASDGEAAAELASVSDEKEAKASLPDDQNPAEDDVVEADKGDRRVVWETEQDGVDASEWFQGLHGEARRPSNAYVLPEDETPAPGRDEALPEAKQEEQSALRMRWGCVGC